MTGFSVILHNREKRKGVVTLQWRGDAYILVFIKSGANLEATFTYVSNARKTKKMKPGFITFSAAEKCS
jgi:hypothetical protein